MDGSAQRPPTQRSASIPMAAGTTSRGAVRDGSPPRTPRLGQSRMQKGKAPMRTLDTQRAPAAHETFLDDSTPVDDPRLPGKDAHRIRDSHDLSYNSNTRYSIVDNMLMSLGSLANGGASYPDHLTHYKRFEDYDFSASSPFFGSRNASRFGADTSFPIYSDYDPPADYVPSRHQRHNSPRGHRSNSSSDFRTGRNRFDSTSSNGYNTGRVGTETPRRGTVADSSASGHARGGAKKGSKSSGSSSVDFAYSQVIGPARLGNRSASFDHGYVEKAPRGGPPSRMLSSSVLERGRPKVDAYRELDDFYAAPQPTVPTRPRRLQEPPTSPPAFSPHPTYAPPEAADPIPKSSTKPATSSGVRNPPPRAPEPPIRAKTADTTANQITSRELHVPAFTDPPAPSPTVATRKPSVPNPATTSAPKERPGFFRRVFGSSRSNSALQDEAALQTSQSRSINISAPGNSTPSRPNASESHSAAQPKALSKASSKEAPQEQSQVQRAPLKKKHSSFFRRRKMSVATQEPPPVLPLPPPLVKPAETLPVQPSPSRSSLFKVMNPYLGESKGPVTPAEAYFDSREFQPNAEDEEDDHQTHGFSPGYAPHKDAAVRVVKPGSRDTDNSVLSTRGDAVKASHSPIGESPKLKLKMKTSRTTRLQPQDQSFLADSSGTEDKGGEPRSQAVRSPASGPSGEASTSQLNSAPTSYPQRQDSLRHNFTPHRKANTGEKRSGVQSPEPLDLTKPSTSLGIEEDEWVLTTPTKKEASATATSGRSNRVWLKPTSSEEKLREFSYLTLPSEGAASSDKPSPTSENPSPSPATTNDVFQSATSLPAVHINGDEEGDNAREDEVTMAAATTDEPTDEDRATALKMYHGEEEFVSKARAAAWLGENTARSARTRKAYMELYDWAGLNILYSMRDLCGKLVLKAETQQVDRVLDAFSSRWCECNSNHGFKATDVVHTICYSILLLNTDLHVADIEQKMTRNQFVRNTLPTIRRIAMDAAPESADETFRGQGTSARGAIPWTEPTSPGSESPAATPGAEDRPSLDIKRSRNRLSMRPLPRTDSDGMSSAPETTPVDNCNVLVKAPFEGTMRGWEFQIEIVLKEFYNSIRHQRLPLHGAKPELLQEPSTSNLSVLAGSMLRRTPSVLSKAPSESASFRGRGPDFRSATARFGSKARSRVKQYPASTIGSSRTSLDDASVWSPAGSSTWSKYSLGKTQTSMSMESLGSLTAKGDYGTSIGFANALSQAIIREEGTTTTVGGSDTASEHLRAAPLLEDETLELHGAPWAKEAILKHKHHLESSDKKSKERNWHECFAVIEKGYMRLFSFNTSSSKSLRLKAKARAQAGGIVGGGNWTESAEELDAFCLRQTIASTLPPPGYSKARPHVWALSLPTGAVHLFQVGTQDIVDEFVSTANYWAARLSKEPLVGGVSNIEYGWSEGVVAPAVLLGLGRTDSVPTSASGRAGSVRSSLEGVRARLPGDRINISDWRHPAQSMMASNLMEVDQLKALSVYVRNVEEELGRHNELRAPMVMAFSSRHPNAAKAMANWEAKSAYLLREIVKFTTYIDSLTAAQALKEKIYAERAEREAANEAAKEKEKEKETKDADVPENDDGAVKQEKNAPPASEPVPPSSIPTF